MKIGYDGDRRPRPGDRGSRRHKGVEFDKVASDAVGGKGVEWSNLKIPGSSSDGHFSRKINWYPQVLTPQKDVGNLRLPSQLGKMSSYGLQPITSGSELPERLDRVNPERTCTIAKCALLGCRDIDGITASLSFMRDAALDLEPSKLRQTGVDFDLTIREKRETFPHIFVPEVESLIVAVAVELKAEATSCLPLHVLQYALEFLQLAENGVLCAVSKDFREAAEGDSLWRNEFIERFQDGGGGSVPDPDGSTPPANRSDNSGNEFKRRYMGRIMDPEVGDQVEVAWRGKFRLDSLKVYNGMAWWVARVVRKGSQPGYYQVHYPGWESRWDEWVPRERLRWGSERRSQALQGITPSRGDTVEMWCEGLQVPGAWLESVVYTVVGGRLHLGEILPSGHFWVNAENVRLVKLGEKGAGDDSDKSPRDTRLCNRVWKLFFGCIHGVRTGVEDESAVP